MASAAVSSDSKLFETNQATVAALVASIADGLAGAVTDDEQELSLSRLAETMELIEGSDDEKLFLKLFRSSGGLEAIAALLEHARPTVHQLALMILGNLGSDAVDAKAADTKAILRDLRVFPKIIAHLFSDNRTTLAIAAAAAQNLCTELDFVRLMHDMGAGQELQKMAAMDDMQIRQCAEGCMANMKHTIVADSARRAIRAATKVQAHLRSWMVRMKLKAKPIEPEAEAALDMATLDMWAATEVQAALNGHLEQLGCAATRVQARARGRRARLEAKSRAGQSQNKTASTSVQPIVEWTSASEKRMPYCWVSINLRMGGAELKTVSLSQGKAVCAAVRLQAAERGRQTRRATNTESDGAHSTELHSKMSSMARMKMKILAARALDKEVSHVHKEAHSSVIPTKPRTSGLGASAEIALLEEHIDLLTKLLEQRDAAYVALQKAHDAAENESASSPQKLSLLKGVLLDLSVPRSGSANGNKSTRLNARTYFGGGDTKSQRFQLRRSPSSMPAWSVPASSGANNKSTIAALDNALERATHRFERAERAEEEANAAARDAVADADIRVLEALEKARMAERRAEKAEIIARKLADRLHEQKVRAANQFSQARGDDMMDALLQNGPPRSLRASQSASQAQLTLKRRQQVHSLKMQQMEMWPEIRTR